VRSKVKVVVPKSPGLECELGAGVGGYPKNSDNYPNTSGDLNTFEYTVRVQRDSDALRK
jgi:hypothetical protein